MISEGRTVAITGAGGFLGRYACRALTERGLRVRAISSQRLVPRGGVEVHTIADLSAIDALERALSGVDAVIHLAGAAHVHGSATADFFRSGNVAAVEAACGAAARVGARHFVLMSSASVVGDSGDESVSMFTEVRPASPYGRSKLEGERRAEQLLAGTPVRLRVLRPPMVYGPGMRGNPLRLFSLVDRGVPLPLGSIRNRRSIISARNLVDAIICAIESDARIPLPLYVSDEATPSTPELVRAIGVALQRPARLVAIPPAALVTVARTIEMMGPILPAPIRERADDIRRLTQSFVVDSSEARAAIGFVPRLSLGAALDEAAEWWRRGKPPVWV